MCCDDVGSTNVMVGICPECECEVDSNGRSADICGYSSVNCDTCGRAECDESC